MNPNLANLHTAERNALLGLNDALSSENTVLHAENTTLRAALHLWLAANQARLDQAAGKISVTEREASHDRALVATMDALSQGEETDADG